MAFGKLLNQAGTQTQILAQIMCTRVSVNTSIYPKELVLK